MPVGAYGYHLTAKLAVSLQDLGVRVRPAKSVFQTRCVQLDPLSHAYQGFQYLVHDIGILGRAIRLRAAVPHDVIQVPVNVEAVKRPDIRQYALEIAQNAVVVAVFLEVLRIVGVNAADQVRGAYHEIKVPGSHILPEPRREVVHQPQLHAEKHLYPPAELLSQLHQAGTVRGGVQQELPAGVVHVHVLGEAYRFQPLFHHRGKGVFHRLFAVRRKTRVSVEVSRYHRCSPLPGLPVWIPPVFRLPHAVCPLPSLSRGRSREGC